MRLERLCFDRDSWPWIDILAALTFPETVRLVAEADKRIIGFVVGDRRRRRAMGWIATLGVHPDFRRMGVGGRLLAECERALHTPHVRLTLRVGNDAALQLYRRMGYQEIERWPRYYRDGEDAIVMEKALFEG